MTQDGTDFRNQLERLISHELPNARKGDGHGAMVYELVEKAAFVIAMAAKGDGATMNTILETASHALFETAGHYQRGGKIAAELFRDKS